MLARAFRRHVAAATCVVTLAACATARDDARTVVLDDAAVDQSIMAYEELATLLRSDANDCDAAAGAMNAFPADRKDAIRLFNALMLAESPERVNVIRERYKARMLPVMQTLVDVNLRCEGHGAFEAAMGSLMPPMTKVREYPRAP